MEAHHTYTLLDTTATVTLLLRGTVQSRTCVPAVHRIGDHPGSAVPATTIDTTTIFCLAVRRGCRNIEASRDFRGAGRRGSK